MKKGKGIALILGAIAFIAVLFAGGEHENATLQSWVSIIAMIVLAACFFIGKWCAKKGWIEVEDE